MKTKPYQDYLIESLKDPAEAAGYLNAALEGGDISVFLLALQNVVKARGGVSLGNWGTAEGAKDCQPPLSSSIN